MKLPLSTSIVFCLIFSGFVSVPVGAQDEPQRPKNVILFVADGFGPAAATMARDFQRDYLGGAASLVMDSIEVGSVQTRATDSRVTDSAASASAYATGVKTYNGAIAVDTLRRPLGTVLEAAKRQGMRTGVVSTTRVTHATPAAFTAHVPQRAMEEEIAAQQVGLRPDLIIGGGRQFFVPDDEGGRRTDQRNLLREAEELGFRVVQDRHQLSEVEELPVLGLLAMDHIAYEVDRDEIGDPSLAELTTRALELLSGSDEGFFVMIEAARIDHAAHGNDIAGTLHDVLALDAALEVALDFARRDGNTLIISVADHETGGLSLGRQIDGRGEYAWHPDVVARVRSSHGPMIEAIIDQEEPYGDVMRDFAGIDSLSAEENELLMAAQRDGRMLNSAIAEVISRRAVVGWTTTGHTGVDVKLYASGPGSQRLVGNFDNAYIGRFIAEVLNLDLDAITRELQVRDEASLPAN